MIGWLNNSRGYLRIRVGGFSPERFMNLCSNKGIVLWEIVKKDDCYEMCISLQSFYELRPIVRKTGTKVAVLERYGLPFLLPGLLKRKMFLAGSLLTVAFWICSSFFIWDIQVEGNYQITTDMLHTFLKENEITVGMPKGKLDIEEMEKAIRRTFTEVTWTSARLSGTKLLISIKENDAPIISAVEELSSGSNLVTEYGGRIVSMIVRKGVPKVAIGDEVEKGSVLVEGAVPIYNEDATVRAYDYVQADGDIVLEHSRQFLEKLPFDYVTKEYTGRECAKYFVRVGDKEWRMPMERPYRYYDSVIDVSSFKLFEELSIPILWGKCTYREYRNVEKEYSLTEAETILNEKLSTFLSTLEEKGVQIIEKNVKIDTNGGFWTIQGDFLVQEQVGIGAAIPIQDIEEKVSDE